MRTTILILLAAALASPIWAQAKKGLPAPDFNLTNSVTTEPEKKTLADCAGEVVFMDIWGIS